MYQLDRYELQQRYGSNEGTKKHPNKVITLIFRVFHVDFVTQCLLFISASFFAVLILVILIMLSQALLKKKVKPAAVTKGKKRNKTRVNFIKVKIKE